MTSHLLATTHAPGTAVLGEPSPPPIAPRRGGLALRLSVWIVLGVGGGLVLTALGVGAWLVLSHTGGQPAGYGG